MLPSSQVDCIATGWGDPHIITFDGLEYDCQVNGEVVMVKSLDSEFEIQGRFTQALAGYPTVTTGIVIRERGNSPRIQLSMATRPDANQIIGPCAVDLYVDGVLKNVLEGTGTSSVTVSVADPTITIEYPSTGTRAVVTVLSFQEVCHFSVDYKLLVGCLQKEKVVGILGSPNGDFTDDWMTSNGTALEIPQGADAFFFEPAHEYCSSNWCLCNASASLFTYENGLSFGSFENCDSDYDDDLAADIANAPQCLKDICEGSIGCLVDGITLGRGAADEYLQNSAVNFATCVPGPTKSCYFSCADALATTCITDPGTYTICPDGKTTYEVYCDQETRGGGWMLLYSYKHDAGNDADLVAGVIPKDPNNAYSHFDVNDIPGYKESDIENVRFYCSTSSHDRVVNFANDHPVIKGMAFDGDQTANDPAYWRDDCSTSHLTGHTAIIPTVIDNCDGASLYTTTGGFHNDPFYACDTNYWSIGATSPGGPLRWECDDYQGDSGGLNVDTLHNVWVRMAPAPTDPTICSFEVAQVIMTWEEHQAVAQNKGCNVASIVSQQEQDTVVSLIKSSPPSIAEAQSIYLGGKLREEGLPGQPGPENWEWADGSKWEYEDWRTDEPNNEFDSEARLTMFYLSGEHHWNDEDGTEKFAAIYKCCA